MVQAAEGCPENRLREGRDLRAGLRGRDGEGKIHLREQVIG